MENPVTPTDIDAAVAATDWDTPIEAVNPLDPDVLLYGADPTPGIVSLDVRNDGTVTVWRRTGRDEVVCERDTFSRGWSAGSRSPRINWPVTRSWRATTTTGYACKMLYPGCKEGNAMEILVERSAQTGQEQRVVVLSRVIAALSQLEGVEQDAVRAAFQMVGREGVRSTAGIDVRKVDAPDPFYVLYIDAAPDVLILARARPDASIDIMDLVGPETLQNLFRSH